MKVRYTPQAFADRERIFEYVKQHSLGGARNVVVAICDAARVLGEQPYSGYTTNDIDVRVKFVVRYPYKVFYRVRDDVVEIAHIRHTSQRPWRVGR